MNEIQGSTGKYEDGECQRHAGELLCRVIGGAPEHLAWDNVHHLQGHALAAGKEIVVIAARDDAHEAVVVMLEDWDAIRLATQATDRADMLRFRAIRTHERFAELVAC